MALQSRAIPVLITRPQPQASRFAQVLRDRFGDAVDPVLTPLLQPVFLDQPSPIPTAKALILTSETGAQAAARQRQAGAVLPDLAYCVGDRTAKVAQGLGFSVVSADGDAEALLQLLLSCQKDAPFLHLRGQDSRGDLVRRLQDRSVQACDRITYAQHPAHISPKAKAILAEPGLVAVPLFSPRTAEIWCSELAKTACRATLLPFALSQAVADSVQADMAANVLIAEKPTQDAIVHKMSQALFGA